MSDIERVLVLILTIAGGGIATFGIVHLIEAQSSQDPQAKSAGVKQLAAGIGLIIVANLLIPAFIGAIEFS